MLTQSVIWQHIEEHDLCPGADSLAMWLNKNWLYLKVGQAHIPVLPLWGLRNALAMHDIHHVVTGYDTTFGGELELAAWELTSGGCGYNVFFWVDRLIVFAIGLVVLPQRMSRALIRGSRSRNLYRQRVSDVMSQEFETLRRSVLGDEHGTSSLR